ncbi:MAG: helix-turn-helix domain-containing protein [Patescibacteria group bacterium]|jgi:sugar-specific transcriptional regulator TrmB
MGQIESILNEIGLLDREIKVYLASLELGESTVLPISKKSGVKRTYCYDILTDLEKKHLMGHIEKGGRRHYAATDPKKINEMIKGYVKDFESILPELSALHKPDKEKPSVMFFEGAEEMEKVYRDIEGAKEICAYGDIEVVERHYKGLPEYIYGRLKSKVEMRELVPKSDVTKRFKEFYHSHGKELRFLPEKLNFETSTIIYGDKVATISCGETIHGLIVESKPNAETQRKVFDTLWKMSEA